MPRKPIIQDNAVIANVIMHCPIGEAFRPGDPMPLRPIEDDERKDMVNRLERSILGLMVEAEKTYQTNCYKPNTSEVDPDYIVRLSTNEFFFYTKEPLTLKEFEELQNKIASEAEKRPSGVQLILGSFAVKTVDNKVMNVVPHITCGQPPNLNFIVKSNTSPLDVRYKIPDGTGNTTLLGVLDRNNHHPAMPMPQIMINGISRNLTFNNVVPCKTPGGTPFITAVDICLDHMYGVAMWNVASLATSYPDMLKQPMSHVVVSNRIDLITSQCLGPFVMHVDPVGSPKKCKEGVIQKALSQGKLAFGNDPCTLYAINKCAILTKEEQLEIEQQKALLINELQQTNSANWQVILSSLPKVQELLTQNYPHPSFDALYNQVYLTIAEQVIVAAYNSRNPKNFSDTYTILKEAGFSLDATTVHKLSKTYPDKQNTEAWLTQQLLAIDPTQAIINELQKADSANWQVILSSLPKVQGLLTQNYPHPSFDALYNQVYLTIAEQVIVAAYNSRNPKNFSDTYTILKEAGFSLEATTVHKLSKTDPDQINAETWLNQQLIATERQARLKAVVKELKDHLEQKLRNEDLNVPTDRENITTTDGKSVTIKQQKLINRYTAISTLHDQIKDKTNMADSDKEDAKTVLKTCLDNRPEWSERRFLQQLTDMLSVGFKALYRAFFSKETTLGNEIQEILSGPKL
jgi:hypothetical protein